MPVPRATTVMTLLLLVSATDARAECGLNLRAYSPGSACMRNSAPQTNEHRWQTMSGLQWVDSSDWLHNPPAWLREVVESRRRRAPLPLLHLWRSQSTQTLLALGVNRRGLPGLYFARQLPY
jgi:hypothetical protein